MHCRSRNKLWNWRASLRQGTSWSTYWYHVLNTSTEKKKKKKKKETLLKGQFENQSEKSFKPSLPELSRLSIDGSVVGESKMKATRVDETLGHLSVITTSKIIILMTIKAVPITMKAVTLTIKAVFTYVFYSYHLWYISPSFPLYCHLCCIAFRKKKDKFNVTANPIYRSHLRLLLVDPCHILLVVLTPRVISLLLPRFTIFRSRYILEVITVKYMGEDSFHCQRYSFHCHWYSFCCH